MRVVIRVGRQGLQPFIDGFRGSKRRAFSDLSAPGDRAQHIEKIGHEWCQLVSDACIPAPFMPNPWPSRIYFNVLVLFGFVMFTRGGFPAD
ncbi:MAG: hypothetical protein ACYC2D_04050 [Thiobacillus sp.]